MNSQVNSKATVGCLALLAAVMLLVSYLATSSLNPLAVYASNSIWGKILVSLLGILLVASLMQWLSFYLLRKSVEIGAGKPAEDVICPGCGLPLIPYIGSHGAPVRCPECMKLWHNGPACFSKDLPPGAGMFHSCFHCRSAPSDDRDLFDDKDLLP